MKKIQRLQFILSPVLIAILSVLLVVVSFSWYQAAVGEIQFESESVSITVSGPEDLEVSLETLGDNYTYDSLNETYTLNQPGTFGGYFGQTGLGSLDTNDLDKPYIAFYKATIDSDVDIKDMINDCFIKSVVITKEAEELENETYEEESFSEFSVYFFTNDSDEQGTYVFINPQSEFSFEEGVKQGELYVGIVFFKESSTEEFKFSDIKYYLSTYALEVSFYLN